MSGLEWQVAEGSRTLHIIDTSREAPLRSGPKAACGRRPQRHYFPWWSLPVEECGPNAGQMWGLTRCPDCAATLGGAS